MNLSRTKRGTVVHDRDCRYANGVTSTALPWEWADTQPKERVLAVIITMGYRMCLHCHPLGDASGHG